LNGSEQLLLGPILTQRSMKVLYTSFGDTEPFSEGIVSCYGARLHEAEAEGIKVRALQISNPHNPSGLCYPRATLIALLQFCAAHNLHFISDEIYALTIFPTTADATPFTSILSIPLEGIISPDLVHMEYGFAKDFSASGLHLGCLVTKNEMLSRAFEAIGILHAPSGASCHIGANILEDHSFVESFLSLSRKLLSDNWHLVTSMLDAAGIPYWKGGNAGYFLWIDLSRILKPEGEGGLDDSEREKELAKRLFDGGVWLNPGQERGERVGWFRVVFSHPRVKVEEGVRR
jgi:1-aminocyclopropane-1-carboxylate synthase